MKRDFLLRHIPPNWSLLPYSEAVQNISTGGRKVKQKNYLPVGKFPVIDQGSEFIGGFTNNEDSLVDCKLPVIVFGDHTKVVKFVNQPFAPGADGVKVLAVKDFFEPRLFFYFTQFLATQIVSKGYARHYQYLAKSFVPLPPLNEQRRIVAKIEELFSELDAGVAALEQARAQLKRYRQALLKAAFEGRLTADWREARRGALEPADALLARIRTEREARWRARLADWQEPVAAWESAGKPGKKPRKPRKPKELPPLSEEELAELPALPEGWGWVRVADVGEVRLGRQRSPKNHTGPFMRPYLRAANATWDGIDLVDVKEMNFSPEEFDIYRLRMDDILLAEASGSPDEVGKPVIWQEQIPDCCFQNTLIRVRLVDFLFPRYLYYHFLKDARTGRFARSSRGVGIHHLGAERLAALPVALPPLAEQHQVVTELESHLSTIDYLDQTIAQALEQAAALRQAILKKAFAGRLVPQDARDEPAGVLLERVRGEKEALSTNHTKPSRSPHP